MADDTQVETDLKPETPKTSWLWIKDSDGKASASVTLLTVSFWVTTLIYILSAVQKVGPLEFRPFDVGAAGSYFIPVLTLYFGRRWTDAKMGVSKPSTPAGINPRIGDGQ